MPTAMRCWTKKAKDGHVFTTCDGNQDSKKAKKTKGRVADAVSKRRESMPKPQSSSEVMSMSPRLQALVTGSMSKVASDVASLLRMKSDEDVSKMMRSKPRPPNRFNEFDDDAEFKRKVDVPQRTMGTRGTPVEKAYSLGDSIGDPESIDDLDGFFDGIESVDFEDLGEIEITDDEEM